MSEQPAAQGMSAPPPGQFQLQNGSQEQGGRPRPEPWEPDFPYFGEPWFEFQYWRPHEGQWHCLVCNCRATDGHVRSPDHQRKCKTPWDYTNNVKVLQATLPPPKYGLSLPIYLKDIDKGKVPEYPNGFGRNYHCMLCDKYVTEDHFDSRAHMKKVTEGLTPSNIRSWMLHNDYDPDTGQRAPLQPPHH